MLFKNKKLETKQKIAIATAAIFALVSFLPSVFVITGQTEAQSRNDVIKETNEKDGQEIAGSIILTKKPDKIADVAKGKGLETEFVQEQEKGKPSIVAVKELPGDGRIKDLEKRADVEDVLPNYVYRTKFTPNDTNYSAQWNMDKISAPVAWDITRGSSDVTIAVIDTGVLFSQTINGTTYTQPDFPSSRQWTNPGETGTTPEGEDKRTNDIDDDGNGLVDDWRGWDFMGGFRGNSAACPNFDDPARYEGSDSYVTQDNDPQPYACDSPSSPSILNKNDYDGNCVAWTSACYVGHGTMVASVAAAASNNSQLVAGIDHNGKIMNMRVIDGYGYTTTAHIVSAIDYAVEKGADVINMSLGMACDNNNFTDTAMENALSAAASAGVVTAAASGNESETSSICYPASSQYVMAVGATDQNDNRHSYSNYSNKLDVVAPAGVPVANAPSAFINSNYYASAGGTSLATPHVAGLAALIKARNPNLTRTEVRDMIRNGADKVSEMGGSNFHNQYGYGRIDLHSSMLAAYGNIRLIECSSNKYIVERNIRRKREINNTAMEMWQLSGLHFSVEDAGCSYPTYDLELDRVIRSRSTGKEYMVTSGNANYIHSDAAAKSWGIENYQNTTFPQFDGKSIHFLNVVSQLTPHDPSLGDSNIRLFKCGEQKYMVERNIRKKRLLTTVAVNGWGLGLSYFAPDDKGCSYPTYDLELEEIIRSRNTGKEYLVDNQKAYWIKSQEAANSWGVTEDYTVTSYPQFNGTSIHFLEVISELPVI